jgi:hypothetical protein
VVGVARHGNVGDRRLGRHAALDEAGRRRGLHDDARAGAAGELRPPGDQDAELDGEHIEAFCRVAADLDHRAPAAGASRALGHEDLLDARQMVRQPAAPLPAPGRAEGVGLQLLPEEHQAAAVPYQDLHAVGAP